ncbi:hypothetical protein GCM10023093_13590 [Nemorincola caseinilytica]|uniref:DUF7033 domain-containing protein n=1 Tax=Nemorincola caseinilytica TaxID=2054315 RepID=A0ABP8NDI1_9BACT
METIVVYSPHSSPRLAYVLDWLMRERWQLRYRMVHNRRDAEGHACIISYGEALPGSISIPAAGLLTRTGTAAEDPATGTWHNIPTLYATGDKGYTLPFDALSAMFYLLSRYEEYGPYTPDKHGRYPATASILHRQGILHRPVVDEWAHAIYLLMQETWKKDLPAQPFTFRPTYDIDMAYSHLYKGVRRIAGAYIRALLRIDIRQISLRTQVLKKKQKDPYDSFRWLRQLHKEYGFSPLYFVLSATRTTRFDKNIHPTHPAMVRIIKNLMRDGSIGIHPSYYSQQGDTLHREKSTLEQVAGRSTTISRQHYIRAVLPHTYRMLLHNNIADDHSMGYGSHLGFRAGTGSSFLWYDIEHEAVTTLRIHPFCFMDSTAHYEAGHTAAQAFEKLDAMCRILQRTGSTLITVFHNFSLGTDEEWKGWRAAYEHFMQQQAAGEGATYEPPL